MPPGSEPAKPRRKRRPKAEVVHVSTAPAVAVPGGAVADDGTITRAGVPPARTRAEVLRARATVAGCCERHADNQGCDCLALADADAADPAPHGELFAAQTPTAAREGA